MTAAEAWPRRAPPRIRKGRGALVRYEADEDSVQIAVINHLRLFGPAAAMVWHTPNGGHRSISEARRFKAMGVHPGVSDVCAFWRGRLYVLELKTTKGVLSDEQDAFLDGIRANGGTAGVAFGLDDALATLRAWGLLPPEGSGRRVGGGSP